MDPLIMLPSAVVEQQAKLGVSAEESKVQRLKRQQARFRDRGGAFVPATSNPLVDILLARTVSGESPSKVPPKDVIAKRSSPSKARLVSSTRKASTTTGTKENKVVAGSSRERVPASRKGKGKAVKPEAEPVTKPAPKRRGTAKGKKREPDPDSDTEQPLPNKSKTSLKGKGKRAAPSTSNGSPKTKPKLKARAKAKPNSVKKVVEVLVSDDDQTLVEVPHKAKPNSKRKMRYDDDGETDDDVPIARKRAKSPKNDSKSSTKTAARVKIERTADAGSSEKKTLEGVEKTRDAKKRPVSHDEDSAKDVLAPPAKEGKVANLMSEKLQTVADSKPAKDVKKKGSLNTTSKAKGKVRDGLAQDGVEPVEGDDERPLQRPSKPKKRKKEEDNYDDRPCKAVKFSETVPTHSSSQELKENQSDKKRERTVKSSVDDEPDEPRRKLATKPPRAKTPKGPPREVLERIKASAARHLRCMDSEPDELDCLS